MKGEISGLFSDMMDGKEMPREYFDLTLEGENYRYRNMKEDSETGKFNLQSDILYDSDLNVLDQKTTQYGQTQHLTFSYGEDGKILMKKDVEENIEVHWEYDSEGRLIKEPVEHRFANYIYDSKGNIIQEYITSDESVLTLTIRKIKYAKE